MTRMCTLITLSGLFTAITITASPAFAETDQETLAKFERNLAEAVIKNDTAAIEPMWADDFYGFNSTTGDRETKAQVMADIKATDAVVNEMNFPPFFIRVFGSTAFVQGTNGQTATYKGKVTKGNYVWFDVFEKRNGHWMWIVSESTLVGAKTTDKVTCDQAFCARTQPGFSVKR
jgi:hypothetical protein